MAVDMFLKLDGIKGESHDSKHKGEIDVLAWSWGMSNGSSTHSGGGGGAGKVSINDITLTKNVDSSSNALFLSCATGHHIKQADLVVRKHGGKTPLEYLKIKLEDIIITSVSIGGAGGDTMVSENVSLSFAKVHFDYVPQKEDGTGGAPMPFGFDIKQHMKL